MLRIDKLQIGAGWSDSHSSYEILSVYFVKKGPLKFSRIILKKFNFSICLRSLKIKCVNGK